MIDITSFDAVAQCEKGQPLALLNDDGTETGITVDVIGKHADAVVKFNSRILHQSAKEAQIAQKKGKAPDPKTLEEIHELNIDGASVRVVGWHGVKQEFAKDLLKGALKRNPHWIGQIIEFSDDIGNFTKASGTN